eukprot:CAMPEP_0183711826 /NCGR_PEP_ID=MMETSP0737-20130205/7203_1 /TAXON_ID=385413 /ORGANISM="Thalassiosira miniscula, Strain CCMP1093" /LENGTH=532 /DNA_ID=CAMNT_0025940393 /DNA_START=181 /DNA_END=1779 /DNA_ORIENTATION=-
MQGANLAQPSMAHMIDDQNKRKQNATKNGTNGSISDHNVSIAYAGGSGRQPVLHNIANLIQHGIQSLGSFADDLFISEDTSEDINGTTTVGNGTPDDDDNGKNRKISCYCLPCLSCGRGERGRTNVRTVSTLFFPLFLLSFFLLDDFGRVIMRNMRIRNYGAATFGDSITRKDSLVNPVLRRKVVNEFPGIRREILFVPLELTVNVGEDTEVDAKLVGCPRGVLFLFHGCSRYAASFFYSPQGRKIVAMANRRGIVVVAFEKNDERGCWEWEEDGEVIRKTGKKFLKSRFLGSGTESLCGQDENGEAAYPPIWAFGASSGGSFISTLASKMKETPEEYTPFLFSAMNVQIMSPPEGLDWDIPTIFTVMEGDAQTSERVNQRVNTKFQGGPFHMIKTSGRKNVNPNHFAKVFEDDPQMTLAISADIHKALLTMGIIDPTNRLTSDPRQSVDAVASIWEKYDMAVRGATSKGEQEVLPFGVDHTMIRPLRPDEMYDANSIWLIEELNVAWDQHEITAEKFEEVLEFFSDYSRRL